MKKINFLFLEFVLGNSIANAQPCSTGRYARVVYDSVKVTSTIPYGANITYSGSPESLTLDFYEPFADTAKARPLIILAHGGSFTSGSSTDFACVALGDSLAKMGYTCASINYRLGISPYDSIGAVYAVIRAVQDM